MTDSSSENDSTNRRTTNEQDSSDSTWPKYADRHKLRRIRDFPIGVDAPKRVRIYSRRDHFLLQWWDKLEKQTLNERVQGDLVSAISRAREIDERLAHFKTSGGKKAKLKHDEIVKAFKQNLKKRADSGEIDIATVERYSSAVNFYMDFTRRPNVSRKYASVAEVDRDFQLEFTTYLSNVQVAPNGHPNSVVRPLKNPSYVVDVIRAMLQWAADPRKGDLLPRGFDNPFKGVNQKPRRRVLDIIDELKVSASMAVDLVGECDEFQLPIFGTLLLYGLRPGELGWLFWNHINDKWVEVACLPELDYMTKGRRDKRFPTVPCLLKTMGKVGNCTDEFVFGSRNRSDDSFRATLTDLRREFDKRRQIGYEDASRRRRLRDAIMRESGQLTYDHVSREFSKLKKVLKWSNRPTLKDLRHLFCSSLENAGVPEYYRRYLMGQSPGNAPIVAYTHLTGDNLRRHFQRTLDTEFRPIVEAIEIRSAELGLS